MKNVLVARYHCFSQSDEERTDRLIEFFKMEDVYKNPPSTFFN